MVTLPLRVQIGPDQSQHSRNTVQIAPLWPKAAAAPSTQHDPASGTAATILSKTCRRLIDQEMAYLVLVQLLIRTLALVGVMGVPCQQRWQA